MRIETLHAPHGIEQTCKFCYLCGQPMKPEGFKKLPNEYDHAQGCPYAPKRESDD